MLTHRSSLIGSSNSPRWRTQFLAMAKSAENAEKYCKNRHFLHLTASYRWGVIGPNRARSGRIYARRFHVRQRQDTCGRLATRDGILVTMGTIQGAEPIRRYTYCQANRPDAHLSARMAAACSKSVGLNHGHVIIRTSRTIAAGMAPW